MRGSDTEVAPGLSLATRPTHRRRPALTFPVISGTAICHWRSSRLDVINHDMVFLNIVFAPARPGSVISVLRRRRRRFVVMSVRRHVVVMPVRGNATTRRRPSSLYARSRPFPTIASTQQRSPVPPPPYKRITTVYANTRPDNPRQ